MMFMSLSPLFCEPGKSPAAFLQTFVKVKYHRTSGSTQVVAAAFIEND